MFKKCLKKLYERRFLVVVLLLFFAVSYFVAVLTFSEKTTSSIWDGKVASSFEKGKGTSTNPYKINTGNELAYFFSVLNGENSSDYFNKYYELNNNIDMDGREFNFSNLSSFSGTFNGNGYTVFNFKINNYYLTDDDTTANFNLFNSFNTANFKNLNLKDITFEVKGINFKSDEVKSTKSDEEETSVITLEEDKKEEVKEEKDEEVKENTSNDEVVDVPKDETK